MLIGAFLATQWSNLHIHLAGHHDHDGSHHQHHVETHAHQLIGEHADAIDSAHQPSEKHVVNLEYDSNKVSGKKSEKPSPIALVQPPPSLPYHCLSTIKLPLFIHDKPHHLGRSTVNSRAPPQQA